MIPPEFLALSGLEQARALMDGRIAYAGFRDRMGLTLAEVAEGRAVFTGRPDETTYNIIDTVHGGYAATMLDFACAIATLTTLRPGQSFTTLEIKVAFHKAMTAETGLVRAEGRVVQAGRRAAFTEATLKDETGKPYASATSTCIVLETA